MKETLAAKFEGRPGQMFLVGMAGMVGTIIGRTVAHKLFAK